MRKKREREKVAAISALVLASVVMGIGWFRAETKPARVLPFPETVENRTVIFHGYEAYLDCRVSLSEVHGPSMEPTFGGNDVILWVEVDPEELKVGDIILGYYATSRHPEPENIVHRITDIDIREDGRYFLMKGDSNQWYDGWIHQDNILGLVIGVIYSTTSE